MTGTDVELPGEAGKPGLTVDAGEDVDGKLLWFFDDDVLSGRIPADHVMVLGAFEEAGGNDEDRKARGDI